jgi:GT2 family glycosyltransferase
LDKEKDMKYSVIMPCLLREQIHRPVVDDCIASVKRNSDDFEFIIVDDGSPLLSGFLKDAADVYIRHNTNKGIAPSWNDGMRVARGEYIVVINDDIVVPHDWLLGLKKPFLDFPDTGVSAPAVWHIPDHPTGIVENYKWFPGYCFMLSKNTIEKVGYFDETFVPYNGEDVDYWYRTMKANLKLMRNYDVVINHKEGDVLHTLGDYKKRSEEANLQFVKKHGFDPIVKFYS